MGELFGVLRIVPGQHEPRFAPFVSRGLGDRPDNTSACGAALFRKNCAESGQGPGGGVYAWIVGRPGGRRGLILPEPRRGRPWSKSCGLCHDCWEARAEARILKP